MAAKAKDRRRFPRKDTQAKVRVMAGDLRDLAFEASLPSLDISIGGVFLQSEFFLKLGTELELEFSLPGVSERIQCSGRVVREERQAHPRGARSGFAIQFVRYGEGAWLALATYFLAPQVRRFLSEYRRANRTQRFRNEEDRMMDLIVAWEMDRLARGGTVAL